MREKVGRITLDYSRYSGQDFYSDGAVEDELLETVKNHSEKEYMRIIKEKNNWPFLYHLSYLRENIVDWIPMDKKAKVLEVGSGCGAITGALARKAGEVTCVDLSKKRSLINAYRHRDCDNVTIHVGNFKDIEQDLDTDYDYICLIGVFEYAKSYIGGNTPFEDFLRILRKHLSFGGRILIAIENKLGLKYFAGCREDHVGSFFGGIENYKADEGVRTFTRTGLERIFKSCGVDQYTFYYPYPDYKFMSAVYSDEYLPKKGELTANYRNFDKDRMLLFDESDAFNGIVEDGLFPVFSNSYLAVVGEGFDVKFTKYSNDRDERYRIKTEIRKVLRQDSAGGKTVPEMEVRKYPMGDGAAAHIRGLAAAYEKLSERYAGSGLSMNACTLEESGDSVAAKLEYVEGTQLSELMNQHLACDDQEGFYSLFREYVKRSSYGEEKPIADYDMIFSNVYVSGDKWTVLDYEWTVEHPVSAGMLAYRALHYFMKETEYSQKIDKDMLLGELAISKKESGDYLEEEQAFQNAVVEEHFSLEQLRVALGNRMWQPQRALEAYPDSADVTRVQIYEDCGEGYKEEQSYFVRDAYLSDKDAVIDVQVGSAVKMLRIDPSMCSCIVKMKKLTLNGIDIPWRGRKQLIVNGTLLKPGKEKQDSLCMVFSTADPNININLEKCTLQESNVLHAEFEMLRVPEAIARDMENGAKKFWRM